MFKKKKLITALTKTANDLEQGCEYEWGHMGRCNAGCLVQNLISKTDKQISNFIMFYERLTKHMLKVLPKTADAVINIDEKHRLKSIKFN